MTPGEYKLEEGEISLNAGRATATVVVANRGDRPIQVGSHFHFFEVNPALAFERWRAYGMRLNITAGTAVRFEPGQQRTVELVALVPAAGPVPPPIIVVMPDISASSICCGQMKWMWASKPPGVTILFSPAMTSVPGPMMMVTPGWVSGLPALPMAWINPSRRPTSALYIPVQSTISALVMTVSTVPPDRGT